MIKNNPEWFKDVETNKWVNIIKIQKKRMEKIYINGVLKYERKLGE